jgi:hypothetical protein
LFPISHHVVSLTPLRDNKWKYWSKIFFNTSWCCPARGLVMQYDEKLGTGLIHHVSRKGVSDATWWKIRNNETHHVVSSGGGLTVTTSWSLFWCSVVAYRVSLHWRDILNFWFDCGFRLAVVSNYYRDSDPKKLDKSIKFHTANTERTASSSQGGSKMAAGFPPCKWPPLKWL